MKAPYITYTAIHRKVLIVASIRIEGTWKAYVTPVPGQNHDEEAPLYWERDGAQMYEPHARAYFPNFADIPYAS